MPVAAAKRFKVFRRGFMGDLEGGRDAGTGCGGRGVATRTRVRRASITGGWAGEGRRPAKRSSPSDYLEQGSTNGQDRHCQDRLRGKMPASFARQISAAV